MKSLHKAMLRTEHAGEPVPLPFRSWVDAGIGFWRGDLSMMAGPPGIGKSTVALTIAVHSGLPTLYFSADSSRTTQSVRIVSMVTGIPVQSVKRQSDLMGKAFWAEEWVIDAMLHADHIKWNEDGQPTLGTVDAEIDTFCTVYGEPPALIVIDNATDVAFDSGDEFSSLRELMRQLKLTARSLNAAVVALHHTSEGFSSDPCPPLHSIHGKIGQVPASVVTFGVQEGFLAACAVKNRNGSSDRSGRNATWLQYRPDIMSLKDLEAA